MKYTEVDRLIKAHGNPVYLDFSYIEALLEQWSGVGEHENDRTAYGLDLNPDFQRGHVWTVEQQTKFVEFMIRGGKTTPIMFNSPSYSGNYRTKEWDLPDTILIVDGKQRLEACRAFMRNELKVFGGHLFSDFEDGERLAQRTSITYMVNHIFEKKALLQWYLETTKPVQNLY